MIYVLIVIIALIAIAVVAFFTWALAMKADGKCPLCAIKQIGKSKLTIDVDDEDNYNNSVSSSPIMGWSSWNTLRNHIDEETIVETAKALKESGLADAGYEYINLDDCWQSSMRDNDGRLQSDLESFPSGIAELCKQINSLGLKLGIYSSNGTLTCEDLPASLGNEALDAKTFASWGVEFVKYDFCHNEKISGATPMIEYVDLNQKGNHAQIHLTPDMAKYTGRAKTVKCKELPSKKAIGFLNHGAGTASFVVNADIGGEYAMTIHYHKTLINPKQYMQVNVNGKIHEVFFPSGKAFTPDARIQLMVKLVDGENAITLLNPVVTRADSSYIQYKRMGEELKNAANAWAVFTHSDVKPITYSICEWGRSNPYIWGRKAGNMWRTTVDILPQWTSILSIYEKNIKLYKYAGPGHVNDPDMLEVGNGKLTPDENRAHFTLWCMMAAPLVLGNDLRKLLDGSKESQIILDILTNKSLILVDQDPLVKPAKRIKCGLIDIIARPLNNGDTVVCFFNKSSSKKVVQFDIDSLCEHKYLQFTKSPNGYQVHDLWDDERTHNTKITATIPKHGVKVFRISQ